MIYSVDESVGGKLSLLDEFKLAEKALCDFLQRQRAGVSVAYAGKGIKQGKGISNNTRWRGGKVMLCEGGIRVPYVFHWPGRIPATTFCDTPVNSVEFYPPLLEVRWHVSPAK